MLIMRGCVRSAKKLTCLRNGNLGLGFFLSRRWVSKSSGEEDRSSSGKRFAALWGNGDYGRLGLGSLESQWRPAFCSAFANESLTGIACGGAHTLFLTEAMKLILEWGWRCRAKLAVRGSSTDPLIGLYQEGTHNVVDIPDCKAHHPNINAAVELLKQGIAELNVEPYDEDQGTGELRYVQMAVTTYNTSLPYAERYRNGKVQVALVWNSRDENSPSSKKLNALANFLWRYGGPNREVHLIHSIWANFQTSINNVPFLFGVPVFEKAAVLVIHLIFRRTGRHLFLTDNDGGKPPLLKRMLEDYSEFYFMYIA